MALAEMGPLFPRQRTHTRTPASAPPRTHRAPPPAHPHPAFLAPFLAAELNSVVDMLPRCLADIFDPDLLLLDTIGPRGTFPADLRAAFLAILL